MHPLDHRALEALGAARRRRHQPFGAGELIRARFISCMAKGHLARMDERLAVKAQHSPFGGFGGKTLKVVELVVDTVKYGNFCRPRCQYDRLQCRLERPAPGTTRQPKIGGQNYEYLVAALTQYKKGERVHPTMQAQGESLSDADIRDIATYLSSLAP